MFFLIESIVFAIEDNLKNGSSPKVSINQRFPLYLHFGAKFVISLNFIRYLQNTYAVSVEFPKCMSGSLKKGAVDFKPEIAKGHVTIHVFL